jgi:hypothetical protein
MRDAMAGEGFIHIVRVDIDPEHEAAFNRWYDETHVPDILACPGWLSAKRFVSVGDGPRYAAAYEVAGSWAFETPEFERIKGFGPFAAFVRNFTRIQLKPIEDTETVSRMMGGS